MEDQPGKERLREDMVGCLLGTAVGDSLGLCCEGLSRPRQRKVYPELNGPRFLLGRGMVSDDTEHTCIVAQALIVSGGEVETFARRLARQLRWWLLGLPAGVGFATLKALLKLWLGFPSHRSGVFSAGNGPAMRSAILGVCYGHDPSRLRELVRASTRITHTDPKAEWGALAVALAAYMASQSSEGEVAPQEYYQRLQGLLEGEAAEEFLELVGKAVASAAAGQTAEAFAEEMGLGEGISGYVYHTVPMVLQGWFSHPRDYRSALLEIVRCGGDTDTTAAILGGIVGAGVGQAGIPPEWLASLWEWPRTVRWMEELGRRLAGVVSEGVGQPALPLSFWGVFARNLFFLVVVLLHGFRRLLPPY